MDTYFIDGLRVTEEDGIFSVDDDEAEFWTVYQRDSDGFANAMFDLLFKPEAEALVELLEERDALVHDAERQILINAKLLKEIIELRKNIIEEPSNGCRRRSSSPRRSTHFRRTSKS